MRLSLTKRRAEHLLCSFLPHCCPWKLSGGELRKEEPPRPHKGLLSTREAAGKDGLTVLLGPARLGQGREELFLLPRTGGGNVIPEGWGLLRTPGTKGPLEFSLEPALFCNQLSFLVNQFLD